MSESIAKQNIRSDVYEQYCALNIVEETIKVPQVNHVLHIQPVVNQSVTEEVSYIDVPVSHFYEQRDYPVIVNTSCSLKKAKAPAAAAPSCGTSACGRK